MIDVYYFLYNLKRKKEKEMKKITLFLVIAFIGFTVACSSSQQGTSSSSSGLDSNPVVKASNKQLAKYPIGGFAYKSSDLNTKRWDWWAKAALPIVNDIVAKMPSGYILQVTGHADSRGPERAQGDKKGNLRLSEERAKTVYDSLKRNGVSTSKITYKGVGSSEPIPGISTASARNRRVTFKIVKK